ncbi:hypothetical protein EWM64_g7145 [Hericium alpestre]|uniref:Uncharacterized protein n=1 Tax=Hericium alpestre TaxID=135208 RepID=A0A4Y9ZS36_9AGAM|nr:hypothetical protein EWM64_g7145 [Hericium alpestre]
MPSDAEGSHELPGHDPKRPHSFDLTLELERQLDNDSLPSPQDARPQSLDPHVLAAIVTTLRMNLADTTRDRDGLQTALDACQVREQKLSSELRQAMETRAVMQQELSEAKKKIGDDEESISMLRSKVEESSVPSKRLSGLFGRMAPSEHIDSSVKMQAGKIELLQREIRTLKDALEEVRNELTEAIEAREASETCVSALREFIAENNVGVAHADDMQSPTTPQAPDTDRKSTQGGSMTGLWGLKLWRAEHGRSAGSGAEMGLPSSSVHTGSTPSSSETLTKKFGGFFVARQQHIQVREPLQSGSDASSVADSVEPVSPASEKPATGLLPELASTSSSDVERTTDAMKGMDRSDIRVVA